MRINNGGLVTLVAFNDDYTEATLSRIANIVYKVSIPKAHFTMQKLEQFTNLDEDSFIGLAKIQKLKKELEDE